MLLYEMFQTSPIVSKLNQNKNFQKWFSGSKLSDAAGNPLIVYHGTKNDFQQFDPEKTGEATDTGWFGKGIYLTLNPHEASSYAMKNGYAGDGDHEQGSVLPLVVKAINPFWTSDGHMSQAEADKIKSQGHDAIFRTNHIPERHRDKPWAKKEIREIVIFDSHNVKSVFSKDFSSTGNLSETAKSS